MNIIVQAGGRGSRLRHHTWNKPKCLVSVRGKPILYHLFDRFPDAKFYVIGDYLYDQLDKYIVSNDPGVNVTLVRAEGTGTASGIAQAAEHCDPAEPVMLIWSDIIVHDFDYPIDLASCTVYTTDAFACRWSYDGQWGLVEQTSHTYGIPGIFHFENPATLQSVPTSGEFVRWFSENVKYYKLQNASNIEELGDFATIENDNDSVGFCRFFNSVIVEQDRVIKKAIDPEYSHLVDGEIEWYYKVHKLGFKRIPKILGTDPLVMSRIQGQHVWEMQDLTHREQRALLSDLLLTLQDLHSRADEIAKPKDVHAVYVEKTKQRVHSVEKLIPGVGNESLTINGVKCPNIFHAKHNHLWEKIGSAVRAYTFQPIHGDPTFSNTIVDHNLKCWLIDPRGYFAHPNNIFGDPDYDFAKVYYSAVGGYDTFNRRKFKLYADGETAEIIMAEPNTSQVAQQVFAEFFGDKMSKIEILHGLIWLALSGYAKDDIDSVIGSFYLGLYYLKQGLDKWNTTLKT